MSNQLIHALCRKKGWENTDCIRTDGCFLTDVYVKEHALIFVLARLETVQNVEIALWNKKREKLICVPVVKNENKLQMDVSDTMFENVSDKDKWEVYLIAKDEGEGTLLRLEHTKNQGRRRYQGGLKVKKWDKPKEYNASERVRDSIELSDDFVLVPRFSDDWQLQLQIAKQQEAYANRYYPKVVSMECENHRIYVTFDVLDMPVKITKVYLGLRGTENQYECRYEKNMVYSIDVNSIDWQPFFWDFTVILEQDGREYECKPRNYNVKFTGNVYEKMDNFLLFSYHTQNHNMILYYREWSEYDTKEYQRRQKLACFFYKALYPVWWIKRPVLMYEKFCKCAQDNAYFMFLYYMNEGKRRERRHVYYVIDFRETDYERIKQYGSHVIDFMSLRHMIYIQAARGMVSTDTIKHAYQWRCRNSRLYERLLKKKCVFLQHGVLALKKVDYIYDKYGGNPVDLFISSSPMEQAIIHRNFHYAEKEIPITGLARWDALKDCKEGTQILFMPTWRNWIIEVQDEEFIKTEYFKLNTHLMTSQKLAELLEKYDATFVFCMHPKFREYMSNYKGLSNRIRVFDYHSEPINHVVMKSSLMITDYSSVSWDMFYMKKPILFYQYDYETYMEKQGSYIDMKTELFGDRAETEEELLILLEERLKSGCIEKEKYTELRSSYLPEKYMGQHRKRIAKAIEDFGFTTHILRKIKNIISRKIHRN